MNMTKCQICRKRKAVRVADDGGPCGPLNVCQKCYKKFYIVDDDEFSAQRYAERQAETYACDALMGGCE